MSNAPLHFGGNENAERASNPSPPVRHNGAAYGWIKTLAESVMLDALEEIPNGWDAWNATKAIQFCWRTVSV
jgi:hypothetical protein